VAVRQAEQAHAAAVSRSVTTKQDLQRAIAALERDLLDASARVARAQDTLGQRDTILAAEAEVARITAELADQELMVHSRAANLQALRDLAAKVHTLEVQRTHAATDGKTCKALLDQLNARAEFVAVVPCRGEGEYAECPALNEAMDAAGVATRLHRRRLMRQVPESASMPEATTAAAGPRVTSTPNTNTSPMLSEYEERGSWIDRLEASATKPSASPKCQALAAGIDSSCHNAQASATAPAVVMASQAPCAGLG
jgi:hypothetical protein